MKKIAVFAGSNSSTSINKQLAVYASQFIKNQACDILDIRDYALPIFSVDAQKSQGIPTIAHEFLATLQQYDAFIISTAEHNRGICAAFKNLLDWTSRIQVNLFDKKPILLMSTSPGGYGGQNARKEAAKILPALEGNVTALFSLPKFHENFQQGKIINEPLNAELISVVGNFEEALN